MKANYPNTVAPLLGGGDLAGYQAGSTFKMFPMLAALDSGMTLSTSFNAPVPLPVRPSTTAGRPPTPAAR